jgi:hypothetical protein
MEIPPAIRAYSIAVAADSSQKKRKVTFVIERSDIVVVTPSRRSGDAHARIFAKTFEQPAASTTACS